LLLVNCQLDPNAWSSRITPKLPVTGNATGRVKPIVLRPSPRLGLLLAGSYWLQIWLISGFSSSWRGSQSELPLGPLIQLVILQVFVQRTVKLAAAALGDQDRPNSWMLSTGVGIGACCPPV